MLKFATKQQNSGKQLSFNEFFFKANLNEGFLTLLVGKI